MLHLEPISKKNWLDAISLEVRDDQKGFVASNAVSLAQLNFLADFQAKGSYWNEEMIGFALYGLDEDDHEYWIYRLMIDKHHQGKGYALKAIRLILEDIRSLKQEHHKTVSLSYEPENEHARLVYQKAGFQEMEGLFIENEQVARYTFD